MHGSVCALKCNVLTCFWICLQVILAKTKQLAGYYVFFGLQYSIAKRWWIKELFYLQFSLRYLKWSASIC